MKRFLMDVPDELHQRLKVVCVLQGKTMKQVVEKLLSKYVEKTENKLKVKITAEWV